MNLTTLFASQAQFVQHYFKKIKRNLQTRKILLTALLLFIFALQHFFLHGETKRNSTGEGFNSNQYYQRKFMGRKVKNQDPHSKLYFDPKLLMSNNSIKSETESHWVNQTLKTGQRLFLYSAYHDGRGINAMVRILGAAPHHLKTLLSCVCVDKAGYKIHTKVDVRQNKEHWALPYSSYYFNCLLLGTFRPVQVGLIQSGRPTPLSWVGVTYPPSKRERQADQSMGLCVKPLHNQYNRAVWLVEFIQLYNLLGVTHFVFYNHSVGPDVQRVLEYFQGHNSANLSLSILRWNLPVASQKKIRTEAQFTALNDCNFRLINRVRYAVMVDLDEFLIPYQHENLPSLLREIDRPHIASFNFKNVFFYLYWENNTKVEKYLKQGSLSSSPGYLITLYKTKRLVKIHRHGSRSKYIVKPENVVEVGNHNIWQFRVGKRQVKVDETMGLSHHYRICEFGGFACMKKASAVDERTLYWASKLLVSVDTACRNIFKEQGGCPEAPELGSPY